MYELGTLSLTRPLERFVRPQVVDDLPRHNQLTQLTCWKLGRVRRYRAIQPSPQDLQLPDTLNNYAAWGSIPSDVWVAGSQGSFAFRCFRFERTAYLLQFPERRPFQFGIFELQPLHRFDDRLGDY